MDDAETTNDKGDNVKEVQKESRDEASGHGEDSALEDREDGGEYTDCILVTLFNESPSVVKEDVRTFWGGEDLPSVKRGANRAIRVL